MDAAEWLKDWCDEHVYVTTYEDEDGAAEFAFRARIDAEQEGISSRMHSKI